MENSNPLVLAFRWLKRHVILMVIKVASLLGVNVQKHLSNPGSGFGKFLVTKIFKNNNKANDKLVQLLFVEHKVGSPKPVIVEIGFGVGDTMKTALELAPNDSKFYGFELSQSMLDDATANLKDAKDKVKLELKDCAKDGLPFADNLVDIVYHANVLYFVPDPAAFLKDSYRALKPGGRLGMSLAHIRDMASMQEVENSPFKNLYDEPLITELCKSAGFSTIAITPFADALNRMLVIATK
jgi:ubiquinone/menaquinone biosynthesis C-methylase UbiE